MTQWKSGPLTQSFREKKPAYSIKGGIGHTMGAAGLIEMIIAMKALREGKVPPTVNLREADSDAEGWVSTCSLFRCRKIKPRR